jgi:para-nitrobenzyl esterase
MALVLGLDSRVTEMDDAAAQEWVLRALGGAGTDKYPVYRAVNPEAPAGDLLIRLLSDFMRTRSIQLAERKLMGGSAPVFMYLFCYQTPVVEGRLKACHALEVPFVFDMCAAAPITGDDPSRLGLAANMSDRWISFARWGDPGWPPYDVERRSTMLFDLSSRVVDDPASEERRAWAKA